MTRWHETGTPPFYIAMYIHIHTHIYVHIYTSQKECLCIFFPSKRLTNQAFFKPPSICFNIHSQLMRSTSILPPQRPFPSFFFEAFLFLRDSALCGFHPPFSFRTFGPRAFTKSSISAIATFQALQKLEPKWLRRGFNPFEKY